MLKLTPRAHSFFFFNDTATTEIYTLSLHDALPIYSRPHRALVGTGRPPCAVKVTRPGRDAIKSCPPRSEEHTSELQSRLHLVCRLLLEKKKEPKPAHSTCRKQATLSP